MKPLKRPLRRVDIQVTLLTAIMVFISSICIFQICYTITYRDMIKSLVDRTNSIYEYVENSLDKTTFKDIESKEDMDKTSYKDMKNSFEQIRNITNVRYLYTAKETSDGRLIYIVDGLDYSANDFRYPGDEIEPEIQKDLKLALSGVSIMPDKIKTTDWGKIFIVYLPVHENEQVVGAIGIEFEADHQYNTFLNLKTITPLISILLCIVSTIISLLCFRRISNPNYQDMYNTDMATQLKNRNSFDIDLHNINLKKQFSMTGIISIDLNNLKKINDTFGHNIGDKYIKISAKIIKEQSSSNMICYRTGGDEFTIIVLHTTLDDLNTYVSNITTKIASQSTVNKMDMSISAGFALFDNKIDKDLTSTYKRADNLMYKNKKEFHKKDKTS